MVNGKMRQIVSRIMICTFAAAACFALLSNLPSASIPVNADSDVAINEDNFPDAIFRKYVSDNCDTNKNGYLSRDEIAKNTSINVYNNGISDLKGIEYFAALTELDCSYNKLTSLDVSKCSALEYLACDNNKLTSLDVSNCTALKELYCYNNKLTSLDVGKCTALEMLECYNNQISAIKIYNCSKLLDAYSVGENTKDRWEELPDTAILYAVADNYLSFSSLLAIDRSVKIFTLPFKQGWNDYGDSWYYVLEDDSFATGWQQIGGKWYFFDEEGIMQTGWFEDGGAWYYLKSSGAMATGWEEVSGVWYYFGTNGKMTTGWQKVGGVDYYLKSNGAMASDEYIDGYYLSKNGAWTYKYRASWKTDSTGTYYQDSTGWYPKNQWLRIDDQWYFFTPDGYKAAAEYWNGYWFNINGTWTYKARASWKKDSKGWYYQDTDGWYPRDCDVKINGKLYNFDAAGYCTNP